MRKKNLLQQYAFYIIKSVAEDDAKNIASFVSENRKAVLIDIGCGPKVHFQETLLKIVKIIKPAKVICCDIVPQFVKEAKEVGFDGKVFDFEKTFPFQNELADIVFANQIIEHVFDIDHFLSEINRILKPKGYLLIGTENLAAWYNIFSLILGYQPFISTNISMKGPIGNPLSLHRDGLLIDYTFPKDSIKFLEHNKVLAYRGFIEILEFHGFLVEAIKGAGYYPFPPPISRFLATIDIRHANRLQIKAVKK